MVRVLIVYLAVFSLFCNGALAQESQKTRGEKTLFLGKTTFGLHIPTLLAPPAGLGIYLGDSVLLGVESGSISVDQDDGNTKSSAEFTNQGIYVRIFTGNSFNFLLAVHQRNWKADATVTKTSGSTTETATASLEAKAQVATLGIGNQWSWDWGLVFGIDWVLGSSLLNSSSTSIVKTSTFVDDADATKELEEFGDFLNEVSAFPGVFNITIGLAF
ncbi:MAG: hypothetical protein COB67_12460 [SAR324 cluster bacterium]|uniref:Outer membrane protein beta-barrel domain-containing protein n=1 Tax=SAR324 cluster bacterium TaxID=2024889 RepID=A0A2A4SR41_9DELT|nr:MAG: hypothetical protein COB67_12460 [SAR324 cluster bacterium]